MTTLSRLSKVSGLEHCLSGHQTRFELKEASSEPRYLQLSESLVPQVRANMLPVTFKPFSISTQQGREDILLAALRDIASKVGWDTSL